jgi:putative ABC transport system permease protein
VGIYGVASYSVSRRTREMGIRLALGARPGILRRRIFSSAMKVVVVGAAVGLMVALGAGRVMEVLLYGITPRDPLALILAPVVLLAASSLAVWIPVHRYTRVDPAVAMEVE